MMDASLQLMISRLAENDKCLSRTVTTTRADVSVSTSKRPLLISGEQLTLAIERNRTAVCTYISGAPAGVMLSSADLNAAIITIASLTLQGMLPASIYRQWDLIDRNYGLAEDSCPVPVDSIQASLLVAAQAAVLLNQTDPVAAAASLEWEIGVGPLHPFYDACGRISRAAAALGLWKATRRIPLYPSRESYFATATEGKATFTRAFKDWRTAQALD